MRHIKGTFTEEEYNRIVEIKNRSGYSWDVFIRKAAESYDIFGEVTDDIKEEINTEIQNRQKEAYDDFANNGGYDEV